MRIKRFIAPDMRTGLRMVREEQGADAVILSNRAVDGGIEIVAATDYDEALVQQALRAATPVLTPIKPKVLDAMPAPAADETTTAATPVMRPATTLRDTAAGREPTPMRETLATRARAVFRLGGEASSSAASAEAAPTLAELIQAAPAATAPTASVAPMSTTSLPATGRPTTSRFDEMMAALAPPMVASDPFPTPQHEIPTGTQASAAPHGSARDADVEPATAPAPEASSPAEAFARQLAAAAASGSPTVGAVPARPVTFAVFNGTGPATLDPVASNETFHGADPLARLAQEEAPVTRAAPTLPAMSAAAPELKLELQLEPMAPSAARAAFDDEGGATHLRTVGGRDVDRGMTAMRDELATMRQLIERELGQFAVERLRGSPARAHVFDALIGYGCDETLAQAVAAKIDPQLDPARTRAPMLAELARMLTVSRSDPLDDGGVIALVGPTGAGKTTTLAKLAARFAARHRARDVAMVTTDVERAGAREQLQAHGRQLGITVCEASGPEGLPRALEQLADYPLVLVDTAGYAVRDLALLGQITWLKAQQRLRSLLVLPANANPHDLGEVVRRYRLAAPEGVVLTKLDETGRLGAVLSVAVKHELNLIYTTDGQHVPDDLATADASRLVLQLEKLRRAADNAPANEESHAVAS